MEVLVSHSTGGICHQQSSIRHSNNTGKRPRGHINQTSKSKVSYLRRSQWIITFHTCHMDSQSDFNLKFCSISAIIVLLGDPLHWGEQVQCGNVDYNSGVPDGFKYPKGY